MQKCKECYHLIKQKDCSSFCYAEGFISEDNPPLKYCPYFLNKNEPIKPCPNCSDIYRRGTDFCKHCKILKKFNSNEQIFFKSKKIGTYSLDNLEEMIKELHYIENTISIDMNRVIKRINHNILNTIEGNQNYNSLKEELKLLRKEINITEQILDIDEIINNIMKSIKFLIQKKTIELKESLLQKIEILDKENKLSSKIAHLDEKLNLLIKETDIVDSKEILNNFEIIFNHFQKMVSVSEIRDI